jgi:Domain of unknown function (DUF4926)
MMPFHELDTICIVQLVRDTREYSGTPGIARLPQIGDVGTIVHVYDLRGPYSVECVNAEGYTVWLADFAAEEMEPVQARS